MKRLHAPLVCKVSSLAVLALLVMTPAFAGLPPDSYYQLDAPLETHSGEQTSFAALAGEPVIVSMFYGSCPHVCPMLISTIKEIEKQLSPEARAELRVVLLSVDPQRDTPAALAELAAQRNVNSDRWLLARTTLSDTRALAAVLGIKYKQLPDGEFNHTTAIILLDANGREIARSGKLGAPDPAFVRQVRAAFDGGG